MSSYSGPKFEVVVLDWDCILIAETEARGFHWVADGPWLTQISADKNISLVVWVVSSTVGVLYPRSGLG